MSEKLPTEYEIKTDFCRDCKANRYFYHHKDGGDWFCQLCGYVLDSPKIFSGRS